MEKQENKRDYKKIWRIVRPILIVLLSLAVVGVMCFKVYDFVMDGFLRPVDASDDTPMTIEIARGSGPSSIASTLYGETEAGRLIRSKTAFKLYIDFSGKRSKLRAGTYTFSKNMDVVEIVNKLASGDGINAQEVITVRLTEGMTIRDMAKQLEESGAIMSAFEFEKLCVQGEGFENFLMAIQSDRREERLYALEGFLFPDTYKIYRNSSESSVINRLLTRFNEQFTGEDIERAEELGLSIDEIVTLASMIEKEAKTADFAKVSAVFHNRLAKDMPLQSDPTVKYVLGVNQLYLNEEQLQTDTPYSTHKFKGLPAGPICNPGKAAISAALYPDEKYLEDAYLYFALKEPESGELAFSRTYEDHLKEVARYQDLWIEYDESQN